MSSETRGDNASSSDRRMMLAGAAATCFLAIVAVVFPYASVFLFYLMPVLSRCLIYAALPVWLLMSVLFAVALFRRRWRTAAIFGVAGILILLPHIGFSGSSAWLNRLGFRVHVASADNYLSKCKLVDFVEEGTKQSFGACEGFSIGPVRSIVFYDTTGQLVWPASRRTSAWKEAASHFLHKEALLTSDNLGDHLTESFYLVDINMDE